MTVQEDVKLSEKVQLRLSRTDHATISKIARARGLGLSGLIRLAVREFLARNSYLSQDEKKALGVTSS